MIAWLITSVVLACCVYAACRADGCCYTDRQEDAPRPRRKPRPDPQSLARANRNSEAARALYGDLGEE